MNMRGTMLKFGCVYHNGQGVNFVKLDGSKAKKLNV